MKNIRIKKVKKMSNLEIKETYLYKTSEGIVTAEVYLSEDTIWATQKEMGKLFDVNVRTISDHLRNIFRDGELEKDSVIRKSRITAADGKKYNTNLYNLDAIISVGYRVNSKKATYFRKWATQILKEYMIKGFALNDEALKNGGIIMKENNIKLFKGRKIRTKWDEEIQDYYYSIIDVIAVLTESKDPNAYWRKLKQRLKEEGNQTVTNCHQLKMPAKDGKMRMTDVATTKQLLRLIQSVPSPNAEPFKGLMKLQILNCP